MRRILTLTAQCIVAVTATMSALSMQFTSPEAAARYAEKEMQKTLAKALEPTEESWAFLGRVYDAIRSCAEENLQETAQKLVTTEGLTTPEQLAEKLEGVFQKALSALEKTSEEKTGDAYDRQENHIAFVRVAVAMVMIRKLPRPETRMLFETHILSKDKRVQKMAMQNYLYLAGAEAIPFLQKSIMNGRLDEQNRHDLLQILSLVFIPSLQEKNKTDDVTKFTAFQNEIKQADKTKGEN